MRGSAFALALGLFLGFSGWTSYGDTYRIFEGAPNGPTGIPAEWGYEQLADAWTHATVTNPGDHTLILEWKGPLTGGTPHFEVPTLTLADSGNITLTALAGVRPEIRPDGDHPVFRNVSTTGKTLTILGYSSSVFERITLWTAYAGPIVDCGDTGSGNGLLALENVNFFKTERVVGPPDVEGAPDGNYLRIDNQASAAHQLKYVQFMGGDNQLQNKPIISTGPKQGSSVLRLQMDHVNFQPAEGAGARLEILNVAEISAVECTFTPKGTEYSTSASAVTAKTTTAADGGSLLVFDACEFSSGDNNLFARLGESTHTTANRYWLYRPVFSGKCGDVAFNILTTGAHVEILGRNPGANLMDQADDALLPGYRVNMDGMTADTGAYARVLRGSLVFDHAQGSIKPSANYAIVSLGALTGDVFVQMNACDWANGAGAIRNGATGGNGFAPKILITNTIFRGGSVTTYIDTTGSNTGAAEIDLRHVTMTSPASSPVYDMLIHGQGSDVLYCAATIFDAAIASNLVPAFKTGYEWTNLAWNPDDPNGLGGFSPDPAAGFIFADPKLDPNTAKLLTGSGALGRASSAGAPDATAVDFEEDPRPLPAGLGFPDIGADETDFAPSDIVMTPDPAQIGDNALTGDYVAALSAVDPDFGDTSAFLMYDTAEGRFKLEGDNIVVDNATLLDAALHASHTVSIQVTDSTGKTFQKSFVINVVDQGGPYLTEVLVTGGLEIQVTFSEPLQSGASTDPMNYTLSGDGQGTLNPHPDNVSPAAGNAFRLTWNQGEMKNLGDITITVTGVLDTLGNPIGIPNTLTQTNGGGGAVLPILSSAVVQGPRIIHIMFSEPMVDSGPGSIMDPANYHWWVTGPPGVTPEVVTAVVEAPGLFALSWTAGDAIVEGQTVTVRADNVTDLAGNTIDPTGQEVTYTFQNSAPQVLGAVATSDNTFTVKFNELMGPGALVPANYFLSNLMSSQGMGTLTVHPSTATRIEGTNWYSIHWNTGEMKGGGLVKVRVDNATDLVGNVVNSNMNSGTCFSIGTPPTVTDAWVSNKKAIKVSFSEPMYSGMTTPTRYTLSGPGMGTLSDYPYIVTKIAPQTYLLEWNSGDLIDGENVTITVTSGQDLAGNAIANPNSHTATGRIKVTVQPQGAQKYEGQSHLLKITATGGEGLRHYQWIKNGDPYGSDSPQIDFAELKQDDAGTYRCIVSDDREETVESLTASIEIYQHLSFSLQPQGGPVMEGESKRLTAMASGGMSDITYQWKFGGQNIGMNNNFYDITNMSTEMAGTYTVEISDGVETKVSEDAVITFMQGVPVANLFTIAALAALFAALGVQFLPRRSQ